MLQVLEVMPYMVVAVLQASKYLIVLQILECLRSLIAQELQV